MRENKSEKHAMRQRGNGSETEGESRVVNFL